MASNRFPMQRLVVASVTIVTALLSAAPPATAESLLVYAFSATNETKNNAMAFDLSVRFHINNEAGLPIKLTGTVINQSPSTNLMWPGTGFTIIPNTNDQNGLLTWSTTKQNPMKPLANGGTEAFKFKINNQANIRMDRTTWTDVKGGDLVGPKVSSPGFRVQTILNDPVFSFFNDNDDNITLIGLQNVLFAVDVPPISDSDLDAFLASILAGTFQPNFPVIPASPSSFTLSPGNSKSFSEPGDISSGNFDYAFAQITDGSGNVTGAFIGGYTVVTPEPSSLTLLGLGSLGLLGYAYRRRRKKAAV
jgi:hypothetical protein